MRRFLGELAFAAGLAAIVALVVHFGLSDVLKALKSVGVGGFVLVALAHIPTLVAVGLAWWSLSRDAPGARPFKFVWARWLRDAGGDVLPLSHVGGYVLGARALALVGVSGVRAAASGLLDLFVEQAAKIPYTVAAVVLLISLAPKSGLVVPALAVLGVTCVLVAGFVWKRNWVRERLVTMAAAGAASLPGFSAADPDETRAVVAETLAPRGRIGLSLCLHLAGWVLGAFEAWVALLFLNAPVSFGAALVIDGLFVAVRMFAFFVPAAVGVQETAYVVLAGLFRVPPPAAVAFSLIRRGRDLVVGAPALILWQVLERQGRRRKAAPPLGEMPRHG